MNARTAFPAIGMLIAVIVGWTWGNGTGSPQTVAQEEDAAAASAEGHTDIAVINVDRLFASHQEFKRRMQLIRREVEESQKQLAVRQAEIDSVNRRLQTARPGSPERDKTQLLLARLQTELGLSNDRQRQQVAKQEALLYSDTYGEITEAVKKHAQANRIRLVLRANDGPIDPNNHRSIIGAVNRTVVYQDGLDITDEILKQLNAEGTGASST